MPATTPTGFDKLDWKIVIERSIVVVRQYDECKTPLGFATRIVTQTQGTPRTAGNPGLWNLTPLAKDRKTKRRPRENYYRNVTPRAQTLKTTLLLLAFVSVIAIRGVGLFGSR